MWIFSLSFSGTIHWHSRCCAMSVLVWEPTLKSTRFRLAFFWLIRPGPLRLPQKCLKQKLVSSCFCTLRTVSRHWQSLLHRKRKVSRFFDTLTPFHFPIPANILSLSTSLYSAKHRKNFLRMCSFLLYIKFQSFATNTCNHSLLRTLLVNVVDRITVQKTWGRMEIPIIVKCRILPPSQREI